MSDLIEEDFDIVAQSYRVVSDADAFDALVSAWQKRMARSDNATDQNFATHLRQHVAKADQLVAEKPLWSLNDPVDKALSETTSPTIVISPDYYVLGANEGWTRLFGHTQGQKADESWVSAESTDAFRSVCRTARERGNLQHGILRVETQALEDRIAEIFPISSETATSGNLVIRLLDPEWTPAVKSGMMEAFGLTKAEADICHALFRLRDTNAIAEERNTSARTVRLQLTSIFNKTGANSQVDLVRLLALLCVRMESPQNQKIPAWSDPYGRERIFTDRTGRKLAYSWLGAPRGKVFVLLHGNAVGITLPEDADRLFRAKGICLMTLSRPGFGNSELRKDKSVIDDTMSALEEFHHHLGGTPLHLVGHTLTGLAIARFARLNPQKVKSFISVGGFFPMHDRSRRKHLPLVHNTFLDLAHRAPWACRMLARTGQRILREKGTDWYLSQAYGHSIPDQEVLSHPVYRALLRNACAHSLSQGAEVFAREFELCHYDGFRDLAELTCPVHLIVGAEDPQMTGERISELMDVQPNTRLTLIADCGELVFYKAWRKLADIITQMAGNEKDEEGGACVPQDTPTLFEGRV